jgi:hypothetical protein
MPNIDSKILIAYEDSASFSAIAELEVFPESMRQISNKVAADSLSFSEFWAEQSWGNAVKTAVCANMIIVSLSGQTELPVPVKRWMDTWPKHERKEHITLLVIFGTEQKEDSKQNALISYFQQIAADHGLDFRCHCNSAKNFAAGLPSPEKAATPIDFSQPEHYQDFTPPVVAAA